MTNEEIQLLILEEEKKLGWCDIDRYNYIVYLYELITTESNDTSVQS